LGSIALGGIVIEKHFTLNTKDAGPDHPHSMDVNEFKRMVNYVRELEAAMGTSNKVVVEEESETVIVQRRGLYTKRAIPKGGTIQREDLVELRPALGIAPKYKEVVIGRIASRNIEADSPLQWNDL